MENKLRIPYPPSEVFANRNIAETIINEGEITFMLDESKPNPIEYPATGGILIHIQGAPYPKKGFPFPEAIYAINLAKKFFVSLLKILTIPEMLGWTIAVVLPFKRKVKILNHVIATYARLAQGSISPFVMKSEYMTKCANECELFVYKFLITIGIDDAPAKALANVVGTIVEYDDAYRFRLEDIMLETTKEKLISNPRKEIKRLLELLHERDSSFSVKEKASKLYRVVNLILLSRKFRSAFKFAILSTNLTHLQPDEGDKYWMSIREDYDYFGTKFKDREVKAPQGYKLNV